MNSSASHLKFCKKNGVWDHMFFKFGKPSTLQRGEFVELRIHRRMRHTISKFHLSCKDAGILARRNSPLARQTLEAFDSMRHTKTNWHPSKLSLADLANQVQLYFGKTFFSD